MNCTSSVSAREAVPVQIGELTMYCENFSAEISRSYAEKSTVNGGNVFSNSGEKAVKITLSGRIYDETVPMRFLISTHGLIREETVLRIIYRGAVFSGCRVKSFSAEDKGEGFIHASVTLVTNSLISGEEEQK